MARIHHILATTVAFALSFAAYATDAEAAKPRAKGAYNKPFRLHFDTDALGFTHVDYDGDAGGNRDADRDNGLGFGVGRLTLVDGGSLGTVTLFPQFGIGFGYAFLNTRAIVGARFSMAVDGNNLGEDFKTTVFRGQFAPYFQWMFLPGSWVRPYVEGRVGIGGGVINSKDVNMGGSVTTSVTNVLYPFGGPGGGVHLFPVDYFSVDLGLNLTLAGVYAKDHQTVDNPDPIPDVTTQHDWNNQAFVLNLSAMVGVSTWF